MVVLRDYQNHCVEAILDQWGLVQSTLLVMATGLGKTVVFADLIRRTQPKRALVIAHREELVFQARDKIQMSTKLHCDIEMAGSFAHSDLFHRAPVVIGTIQSLTSGGPRKRMHRFKPTDFDIIIIDECHHAPAKTYLQFLDYFKLNQSGKIAGFTATPNRTDEESLGQIFQSVAARYDIADGIENGWLCPITQQFIPVSTLDYSHISKIKGDFNQAELAAVMESEENIAGITQPSLEVIFGLVPKTLTDIPVPNWSDFLESLHRTPRRTIVFTSSVLHAEKCCNIFNRAYPGIAEWVCGETFKDTRKEILGRFQTGETSVLVNCSILTEGYDNPFVEVIIMARPTQSETLYRQMVGRSTRPLPGLVDGPATAAERKLAIASSAKKYCRIADFEGNAGKHNLISCMDILGGKVTPEAKRRAIEKAKREGKPVLVSRAMENAELEIVKEKIEKAQQRKREEEARKAHLVPKSNFSVKDVNPFGFEDAFASKSAPKPKRQLTSNQFNLLVRHGYDPAKMPVFLALKKIGELMSKFRKNAA